MSASKLLYIAATLCFGALAIIGLIAGFNAHDLLPIGLTAFAAAHAV